MITGFVRWTGIILAIQRQDHTCGQHAVAGRRRRIKLGRKIIGNLLGNEGLVPVRADHAGRSVPGEGISGNAVTAVRVVPGIVDVLFRISGIIKNFPGATARQHGLTHRGRKVPRPIAAVEQVGTFVAVFARINEGCSTDLLEVGHRLDAYGFVFGVGQSRQQHGRQKGDDRDDNQELNQRETAFSRGEGPESLGIRH